MATLFMVAMQYVLAASKSTPREKGCLCRRSPVQTQICKVVSAIGQHRKVLGVYFYAEISTKI